MMINNPIFWLGRVAQISEMEKSGRLNRAHAVKELHSVMSQMADATPPLPLVPEAIAKAEDALSRLNRQLEAETKQTPP